MHSMKNRLSNPCGGFTVGKPEHFAVLEQGVEAWNKWRKENPEIIPNLNGISIRKIKPQGTMSFEGFASCLSSKKIDDLKGEDFEKFLDTYNAYNFDGADLKFADMRGATLKGISFRNANLSHTKFQGADITRCDFSGAVLNYVEYDDNMKCRLANISNCTGSQRFIRHVMDLDYIEETKEKHPIRSYLWGITSDYGRSWGRLAVWCCCIMLVFGAIFAIFLETSHPFSTSVKAFTSLGFVDAKAHTTPELIAICIEAALGYVMFGALVSLIVSQMARRSG